MSVSVSYIRVSTEDQIEYSPEAQAKRCREYARVHDLGPVREIRDEGWSAKSLDRPGMQELLGLIETGVVANLVTWRLDRLTRDTGDLTHLVRLCEQHCVTLHSVNEGRIDVGTAAGRMNVGMHGVFAQYYREHNIENVRMGMRQAAEQGRWLNRPPTGYDMTNGYLIANEQAALVRRIFALRVGGDSYARIEAAVGISYSTVRQILHNRVYLGEVRLRDEWFPGVHEPLIKQATWDAIGRAHIPGRRRGRDLLAGRVHCGLCGKVSGIDYNERGQGIYRCRHRGRGCAQPGRSANGLHRAAVRGLGLIADDDELQAAIRDELLGSIEQVADDEPSRASLLASLNQKRRKLLDLHYADQITAEAFAQEEGRLSTQIGALHNEEAAVADEAQRQASLADTFEAVAQALHELRIEDVWEEATPAERRMLVEDLIDAVIVFPDHLQVKVSGAPPLNVTLAEVGLRDPGTTTSVSEG